MSRDFLSPAYTELSDSFFDDVTDDDGEEDDSGGEMPVVVEDVLVNGDDPRKRITGRDRQQPFPDIIPDSQPGSRSSAEVLPDSQPFSSGSSGVINRSKATARRVREAFGKVSDSDDSDNDQSRPTNGKTAKNKTDGTSGRAVLKKRKRIDRRAGGERVNSKSDSDSSPPSPRRGARKLVSVVRTERESDSDDSLKDFTCADNMILRDDGKWEMVDEQPVHKIRKRRHSGIKQKSSKHPKRRTRRRKGSKSSESSSDSDAPVVRKNSDGEEEEEWVVERIMRKRKRNGEERYYIKWKGFPDSDNTWEPVENLANCPKKVEEFEKKLQRMKADGKATDDVEISEDGDDDDDAVPDSVTFYDAKIVLFDVLKRAQINELDTLPDGLTADLECLLPRQWLSDFLIDDTITVLLDLYQMNDKVVYLPHHCFSKVLRSVEDGNYVPNSVLEYLSNQNAGLANVILVCASTSSGKTDVEAEHFALGVIVKFNEKVVLLDSIKESGANPRCNIFKALHVILAASRRLQSLGKPDDVQFLYSRDCPQQKNSYDCGLFVIINVVMMLTQKQMKRDTIRTSLLRRFVYTLMNDRNVMQPEHKRSVPPDDILLGTTKRECQNIAKYSDTNIERKNTNALIRDLLKS